jgi:hypothetical protein
MSEMGLAARRK